MLQTESFRTQHSELLGMVGELSKELDPALLQRNASNAHRMLRLFTERLKFHLNMEDKLFYPKLLNQADEKIKSTAQRYIDEMGSIPTGLFRDQGDATSGIYNKLAGRPVSVARLG